VETVIRHLKETQELAESWSAEEVLGWSFRTFGASIEMASGFGPEGMALIDIATTVTSSLKVFTIDTGFLFPETYQLIEEVERRYGIRVDRVKPRLTPDAQAEVYGDALWATNPDQCCSLRKVEPLKEKLSGLRAWITAIRRDQTKFRANAKKVEWDQKFQLVKINPIANWTNDDVWDYIQANNVPYNPLHDLNYTSIGCTHCTRAVRPGEDPRAGRWAGFQKTECGLHLPDTPVTSNPLIQIASPSGS
jgi:phosphoadenosine phosphosulfate reductase